MLGIRFRQQQFGLGAAELTESTRTMLPATSISHALRERLDMMLEREERRELAATMFDFVPTRAKLDLAGWDEVDLFFIEACVRFPY